ncbi:hypothetical protein [Actinomadura oligospora]|uniref:hypothetical protein n=1 Tax=Actinomadura oligospora TaxID=111804 RepID=UPI0004B0D6A9|nr:hypothetical protein [Actinomadura oligospora]
MSRRIARVAAALGAAAMFGVTGAALAGTASAAPAAESSTTAAASGYFFVAFYPNQAQCVGGGEYYMRSGYSSYICQLDPWRGWALYVQ